MSVNWTKSYDVRTEDMRHFKVHISEESDGAIYASCLWYEGDRMLKAPGQAGGGLRFDLKTVLGSSEQDAYDKIVEWITQRFGSNLDIQPRS
jgi:hypothetical protein